MTSPGATVAAAPRTLRADHLWGGDRIEHTGMVLIVQRVAVTPGEPVAVIAAAGARKFQLSLAAGEKITVLP